MTVPDVRRRERIEVRLACDGVRALPVATAVGVFAPHTELDRPVFAELLAHADICCCHVLVVAEVLRGLAQMQPVERRVRGHVVVGR